MGDPRWPPFGTRDAEFPCHMTSSFLVVDVKGSKVGRTVAPSNLVVIATLLCETRVTF